MWSDYEAYKFSIFAKLIQSLYNKDLTNENESTIQRRYFFLGT